MRTNCKYETPHRSEQRGQTDLRSAYYLLLPTMMSCSHLHVMSCETGQSQALNPHDVMLDKPSFTFLFYAIITRTVT